MALTGRPLIVLAVLGTLAVLAATVLSWRWGRRRRFLLRPFGVLLTEAMLLLTVGLIVNRAEQFYPTWSALTQHARTSGTTFAVPPGGLDGQLRALAGPALDGSVTLTWQPGGSSGWHLAQAPTVVTPAGYLLHPGWRYPALLVLDDGTTGWTPAAETAAARGATATDPAVVVFARTTAATTVDTLTTTLPGALGHDLRVTGRRWALVAAPGDAALARRVVTAAPARYPAVALITRAGPPRAAKITAVALRPAADPPLPAGIDVTTTSALPAALAWACRQTPPPLAPSAPPTRYLPPHPRPHRSGAPSASSAPNPHGGSHVPGQRRH